MHKKSYKSVIVGTLWKDVICDTSDMIGQSREGAEFLFLTRKISIEYTQKEIKGKLKLVITKC